MSVADASAPAPAPRPTDEPTVEVVLPCLDEAAILAASVERLAAYLQASFPFSWRVTVVDSGSSDATIDVARRLAAEHAGVQALRLEMRGRGRALREAWARSDAAVVAYMDVDLSTRLESLLPLVAPLLSGHSDVAIGTRLARGASVRRRLGREVLSRGYNGLVAAMFGRGVSDAQCGFKALRRDVAERLVPLVHDDSWFFDTELLLLARANGMRIYEVPVTWIEDLDSRVDVPRTILEDLRGLARMRARLWRGGGRIGEAA